MAHLQDLTEHLANTMMPEKEGVFMDALTFDQLMERLERCGEALAF
jgi:hypothetical protein